MREYTVNSKHKNFYLLSHTEQNLYFYLDRKKMMTFENTTFKVRLYGKDMNEVHHVKSVLGVHSL